MPTTKTIFILDGWKYSSMEIEIEASISLIFNHLKCTSSRDSINGRG